MYWDYISRSSHQPHKLARYLDFGQYFPVQIEKIIITALLLAGDHYEKFAQLMPYFHGLEVLHDGQCSHWNGNIALGRRTDLASLVQTLTSRNITDKKTVIIAPS